MTNGDQILRGYAVLSSLKANLPDQYEVEAEWILRFNAAVEAIEQGSGIDLTEFKVSERELYRSVATSSPITDEVTCRDGLWLRRNSLMQRSDAILTYFTGLQGGAERRIAKVGFHYYLWTSLIHTGAEFHFQPIRQFIRYGKGDWRSFIRLTAPHFIAPLAEGKAPIRFSHFFGIWKTGNYIVSAVQFFVGPNHVGPPSLILLGNTSKFIEPRCHWVGYYGEKVDNYDGEIREMPR